MAVCVRLVLSLYPASIGSWESEFSDCLLRLSGSKTQKLLFLNMGTWFQCRMTNKNGRSPPRGASHNLESSTNFSPCRGSLSVKQKQAQDWERWAGL